MDVPISDVTTTLKPELLDRHDQLQVFLVTQAQRFT